MAKCNWEPMVDGMLTRNGSQVTVRQPHHYSAHVYAEININ